MVKMKPPKVYVHKRVFDSEPPKRRFDRMMGSIQAGETHLVDDAALEGVVRASGWRTTGSKRTGEIKRKSDPIIVFNTFRFLPEEESRALAQRYPSLSAYHFLGAGHWSYRDSSSFKGGTCKSAYEIHSAWGCYHACDYCHVEDFFSIILNLEELVGHLDGLVKRESQQQLYKYDNQTDTICLEPEYGASELLVNYFARQEEKYLLLYTKSDNVDHLLKLDHTGHTIINWTISCDTVAKEIEKRTPAMKDRIQAAARCQKAGYAVRFRFSPIVPIRDWQTENRRMIEEVFEHVRPDLITMDVLGWMSAEQIKNSFDLSLFDDEHRGLVEDMARGGVARQPDSAKQVFPHPNRLRIYRFFIEEIRRVSAGTPIAICNEAGEMWEELSGELGMSADDYVCCCGPRSVPGHPMLGSFVS